MTCIAIVRLKGIIIDTVPVLNSIMNEIDYNPVSLDLNLKE
jgi:hypothetical protein